MTTTRVHTTTIVLLTSIAGVLGVRIDDPQVLEAAAIGLIIVKIGVGSVTVRCDLGRRPTGRPHRVEVSACSMGSRRGSELHSWIKNLEDAAALAARLEAEFGSGTILGVAISDCADYLNSLGTFLEARAALGLEGLS